MSLRCPFCAVPAEGMPAGVESAVAACQACLNPYLLLRADTGFTATAPPGGKDLREIAASGSIGGQLLASTAKRLDALPVLPEISNRVTVLLRDPEASLADLAKLIEQDAVIAARVLQVANSAMYGGLSRISDLTGACTRLGMRTVANTVQAAAAGRLYATDDPRLREMMRRFWRHSVVTAYFAGELAKILSEPRSETLFVAGLIHDIGKVAVLDIVSNTKEGALKQLGESPVLLEEVLTTFHPLIGLHVVQRWNLPAELWTTTYYHHNPSAAPGESSQRASHIVALSNCFAQVAGYGSRELVEKPVLLGHASTKYLGLTDIRIATLRADMDEKLGELVASFE